MDTEQSAVAALQRIPTRRLKPIDGLVVTAAVWEEAHDYHRLSRRAHDLLAHGCGILAGLDVVASDPPDATVYIRPGAAIDPNGELIVVPQPVAYDLGQAQGDLYLVLTYAESDAQPAPGSDSARLYAQTGYQIEARPTLPQEPHVELARVRRQGRQSAILNATVAAHPGVNEIDQRARRIVALKQRQTAGIAVCYVGDPAMKAQLRAGYLAGVDALAGAASRAGNTDFWVDDDVALSSALDRYALVYVVGLGAAPMSPEDMNGLYACLQRGGTVLLEGCHRVGDGAAADAALLDALGSLGVQPAEVQPGHALLSAPWLFAVLPAGYDADRPGRLLARDGVIFSASDYGSVWQGLRRGGPATREEIRAAHELGANMLVYALRRAHA